jgi:hypothetical protein
VTDRAERHPDPEPRAGPGALQLWHGSDRLWRYRFLHPAGTVVRSNRSFLTREEADESARLAYPGVPVVELSGPPAAGPKAHPWRKLVFLTAITGGVGLILVGAAKMAMFLRRLGRGTKQAGEWIRIATDLTGRKR